MLVVYAVSELHTLFCGPIHFLVVPAQTAGLERRWNDALTKLVAVKEQFAEFQKKVKLPMISAATAISASSTRTRSPSPAAASGSAESFFHAVKGPPRSV